MANLIDSSYFIGDLEIANVNQPQIAADINNAITIYEQEALMRLMGYPLYKEYLAAVPVVGDKWDKLINGSEFTITYNNATYPVKWEGLKGANRRSLIAYYVYFHSRMRRISYNAGTGAEVKPESDNSVRVSEDYKLVKAWNTFVELYGSEYVKVTTPPEFYKVCNLLPSAYNYLLANIADFPLWRFSPVCFINRFGL